MILCCGEALIDMVPDDTGNELSYHPKLGGSVFNTARALGRLGATTGFLSGVSNDPFGAQLIEALQNSNVDVSTTVRKDGLSTLAFVHLEHGEASYRFYDENSAGRMIQQGDFPPISAEVKALFFGGISLCFDPAATTYQSIFRANATRNLTMIDANVRPAIVSDTGVYFKRLREMISACDIVKVSEDDLNLLVDGEASNIEKLKFIKTLGPSIVVLTNGGGGISALYSGDQAIDINVPEVRVKDTIGAGDTFNAGFLAMLERLDLLSRTKIEMISAVSLRSALEYGVEAATIVVQREGANPPWTKELV